MKQRVLINSVILLSFFLLPWWFSALLAVAALFRINNFWEIILWGFLFDVFYGIHGGVVDTFFWDTVLAAILYVITIPIRKRLTI